MEIGLSEFTFGFAFLSEQTRRAWGEVRFAPILPSLQREEVVGYDAWLPTHAIDFYFQFKMAEQLIRSSARFAGYGMPHFRFSLYRRENNRQHRVLYAHANNNPNTYYVAPEFNDVGDLNAAFLNDRITEASRLVAVSAIGKVEDADQHFVIYAPGREMEFHSKEGRTVRSEPGRELEKMFSDTRPTWKRVDQDFASRVLHSAEQSIERLIDETVSSGERNFVREVREATRRAERTSARATLAVAAKALTVVLGVTLVLVGSNLEQG